MLFDLGGTLAAHYHKDEFRPVLESKPAKVIFDHAARLLEVPVDQCCFVGDDVKWDAEGAARAGMQPILLDREGRSAQAPWPQASTLVEVAEWLRMRQNAA